MLCSPESIKKKVKKEANLQEVELKEGKKVYHQNK